ncbi:hypothetical protein HNQ94_001942 [Salirhabdus euzebyi]|uniref:DUF4129 domain-containing protein n=1 Tax=Salirhabdus euzebyi TaxID=394506 RepID=A0A841Q562_9BACI|nr:hypothetical protein [Salirhabdus euzebyi]MBB6453493.1 hypothetical protein [Salirhabdus euzebyi]
MNIYNKMAIRTLSFINEVIFIYFFIAPVFFYLKFPFPYVSYLLVVFLSAAVFWGIGRFTSTYSPFLIVTPLMAFIIYYLFAYPAVVAVLLAIIFSWRFIKQLDGSSGENERLILIISFVLAISEALIFKSDVFIWIGITQFILLLLNHLVKQYLAMAEMNEGNKFSKLNLASGPAFLMFIFLFISAFLLLFFDVIVRIASFLYSVIHSMFIGLLTIMVKVLGLTGIDMTELLNALKLDKGSLFDMDFTRKEEVERQKSWATQNREEIIEAISWTGIVIGAIVALVIIFILYKKKINRYESNNHIGNVIHSSNPMSGDKGKKKNPFQKFLDIFSAKSEEPARKLFFDFEKFAHKKGYGRSYSETIEEWFTRLSFPVKNVDLYQKVRYGEERLSQFEMEHLKKELTLLRHFIKERSETEKE